MLENPFESSLCTFPPPFSVFTLNFKLMDWNVMSFARDFELTDWQMGYAHHGVNAITPGMNLACNCS